MKALLDAGMATQQELLTMVAEERARVDGPAVRVSGAAEIAA
jgi:hypothetical protein